MNLAVKITTVAAFVTIQFLNCPVLAIPKPYVEGKVDTVENILVQNFDPPDIHSVVWASEIIQRADSKYIIVYFDSIHDRTQVKYSVRFRNPDGDTTYEELTAESFGRAGGRRRTVVIPASSVVVEILADQAPAGLSFRISGIGYEKRGTARLSVSLPDEREHLVDVQDAPELIDVAAAVAKLIFRRGKRLHSCTGFLVDENRFVTNEHCISTEAGCTTATAIFGYEKTASGGETTGSSYSCKRLLGVNVELDVAILELSGTPGADGFGWLELASENRSSDLIMIQHPGGEPKQVSREDCKVTTAVADGRATDTDFGHKCDTKKGSSGAPVLDGESLAVVGLHHWGFATLGRWARENRAVRIDANGGGGQTLRQLIESKLDTNEVSPNSTGDLTSETEETQR